MVVQHLAHIDFLDDAIDQVSGEVAEHLRQASAEEAINRLDAIPGIGQYLTVPDSTSLKPW
jgi:hypothetical protein